MNELSSSAVFGSASTRSRCVASFIGTEVRMHRDADGRTKAYHNAAAYGNWKPYGLAFDDVAVVGRVELSMPGEHGVYVDGPHVGVIPLPFYHGLPALLLKLPMVARRVFSLGDRDSIFIGKLPEPISLLLFLRARFLRATFVGLVVSEPVQLYRALFPGLVGRLLAGVFSRVTRGCVRRSSAVIYVTQRWLQRLYPALPTTPTLGHNRIDLDGLLVGQPREYAARRDTPFRLVAVGSMESAYKGFDELCTIVRILRERGHDVELTIVGDGRERATIQAHARSIGVGNAVHFTGHIEVTEEIRSVLDASDLFVMASLVEGLPRALIEAMARALPAASTRAGGIEELLDDECLVAIGDTTALTNVIEGLLTDPGELDRLSRVNWDRARQLAAASTDDVLVDFLRESVPRRRKS